MADLTLSNLKTAGVGFKKNFQTKFDAHTPMWDQIATLMNSTTASNEYGWLGDFPAMREWFGERVIKQMDTHGYTLKNRKFESTIGMKVDDLSDDNLGVYGARFGGMGETAARHPDELTFETLELGFTSICFDKQNFFDEDHPVFDKDGKAKSVSNLFTTGTKGPNWYLLDTSRSLKPLIRQQRQKPVFNTLTDTNSENVFMRDEVLFGVKSRENVGFGFWQMAFASRQEFTPANFKAMYTAMTSQEGDYGKKLALKPTILLVPSSLEDEANLLMNAEKFEDGKLNPHKKKCKVVVSPWLSNEVAA